MSIDYYYDLIDELEHELESSGDKLKLEQLDCMIHTLKGLYTIVAMREAEESNYRGGSYGNSMTRDGNGGNSRRGDNSYDGDQGMSERYSRDNGSYRNRRRNADGRFSRDNGYSREEDGKGQMIQQLRDMLPKAESEDQRDAIKKLMAELDK